jgi:opacity protein-like surface antigen
LAYVKGGAAWANSNVDMIINNDLFEKVGGNTANTGITSWGWTLGAGAEYAMTAHWTVRAEYDYMDLGSKNVLAPNPSVITAPTAPQTGVFFPVPGTTVSQQIHVFKLGLNYKLGSDVAPFASGFGWPAIAVGYPTKRPIYKGPETAWGGGWEVEGGARYWYSSGRFQQDVAPANIGPQNPTLNISRLTWDNLTGNSGELFARIESPSNIFVKGFVGGGSVSGGKINDEDWGSLDANTDYSNTLGNAFGTLGYATVDAGYDVFRGAGYKLGIFAGYNIYTENKSSTTSTQIALPPSGPPLNVFVLGENDKWQSLRIGANAETMLTPQLKLVADVAFLPYVRFDGQDFHPLRPFLAPEWGRGIGTQVEAFLHYYLTPQFSVGVGGHYWAMWTTDGASCHEQPFGECPVPLQNLQYKTERYGVLFQGAYRWDEPVAIARK